MKLRQWLLISTLLIISSIALGIVCYANYRLDRENSRVMIRILSDSQAQAAELSAALQELQAAQQQLQQQFQTFQTASYERSASKLSFREMPEQTAMPIKFAALTDTTGDASVLRSETAGTAAYDYRSPDEYWEELHHYADRNEYLRLNPQQQQQFLEDGAALIQKLEKVETHFRIDSESIQFIEAQLGDGGIAAIESLYRVKKQLAGYVSEGKQYRRELEAMLQEPTTPALPKVTHQLPRLEGRESEYYHPALVDSWVICDSKGNFLLSIRFVYRTQVGGFPKVANVEDTINLRTMQSINGSYHYPKYVMQEIYSLVRKSFRQGFLKFHGMTDKAVQLQQFLSLIS